MPESRQEQKKRESHRWTMIAKILGKAIQEEAERVEQKHRDKQRLTPMLDSQV